MQALETSPLAARLRPHSLEEYVGQTHLLAPGKPLGRAIETGHLHSMILWGPPGTGKTTLAYLLAEASGAHLEFLSAVLAGVKEIRALLDLAETRVRLNQGPTLVFVDEIHRFNKSQQDAFLPALETGLLTLIGATTENPAFSLNNALLSRARVYVLKALSSEDLQGLLTRALTTESLIMAEEDQATILAASDGDARQLLNLLEMCGDLALTTPQGRTIQKEHLEALLGEAIHRFDRGGDYFYDLISALHKSIRGSDPDAALYWLLRMLYAGTDPLYVARRLIRMASEDIGNADPRALELTLTTWQVVERLGLPEAELALAQAVIYLAVAPKSNAVYLAHQHALTDVKANGSLEVPAHLRNKPVHYRYPHDEPHAYAPDVNYFPAHFQPKQPYYMPCDRGLEKQIQEKLKFLQQLKGERKNEPV